MNVYIAPEIIIGTCKNFQKVKISGTCKNFQIVGFSGTCKNFQNARFSGTCKNFKKNSKLLNFELVCLKEKDLLTKQVLLLFLCP